MPRYLSLTWGNTSSQHSPSLGRKYSRVAHARALRVGVFCRALRLLGVGNLALHPYVVYDLPLAVAERRDEKVVPELGAVGLVVEEAHGGVLSLAHTFANLVHRPLVRPRALQEAAVPPEHVAQLVACHLEKAGRGEDDRVVRQARVRHCELALRAQKGLERQVCVCVCCFFFTCLCDQNKKTVKNENKMAKTTLVCHADIFACTGLYINKEKMGWQTWEEGAQKRSNEPLSLA
mmetsp:Transcript_47603/g.107985  ORF Transcript_47603/g.107985 Transcript_47603/m.107985 type:complete len:234 (+) Transcript_47603:222-923(+)